MNVENADGEEQNMTEVYTGYYDLTHNGYKEKDCNEKVHLEEENENLTEALHKAGNWGTVEAYEYLGRWTIWNHSSVVAGIRHCPCGERTDIPSHKRMATIIW